MAFVKTTSGAQVRVNAVREAYPSEDKTVTLCLDGGVQHIASADNWDRAKRNSSWQVAAAAPGTYVLGYVVGDADELSVARQPVVAWALATDGSAYPVTQDGVAEDIYGPSAVLHPDGCVRDWDGLYESEEHWLADMRDQIQVHLAGVRATTSTAH